MLSKWFCHIQVRRLEAQGVPSKQAEAITAAITEVLNDSLENVAQSFVSRAEMQKVRIFQCPFVWSALYFLIEGDMHQILQSALFFGFNHLFMRACVDWDGPRIQPV